MKYVDKYPNLQPIWGNGDADNVLKSDQTRMCFHCHEPTQFVELSFETYVCSEECSEASWKYYYSFFEQDTV